MTSLYKQSVPIFIKYLNNLSALVKKGAAFADEKGIQHDEILTYRLISDMRELNYQVQSCCNTAVFFVDRVGGLEHIAVEDDEKTFDQLHERIEKTIAYLNNVDPKAIDDKVDSPILMETRMGKFEFASGQAYFSEYALANFHFHLASGYCILRTQGVPVGALDYLKDVLHKVE